MKTVATILIIVTSHAQMGDSGAKTGVWLEELTTPYYAFADAGSDVSVVSIDGGPIPIDPRSIKPKGENEPSVERYLDDPDLQRTIADSKRLDLAQAAQYDAVFLPGGHGTMWDYPKSEALATLVGDYLDQGKVVAAVCHGPAGLVSARNRSGEPVVKGQKVAGFTNSEERAAGFDKTVPFLLEDRLRELGAVYVSGPDFKPFAVRDGTLITGQNPASAADAAKLVMDAVRERRSAATQ